MARRQATIRMGFDSTLFPARERIISDTPHQLGRAERLIGSGAVKLLVLALAFLPPLMLGCGGGESPDNVAAAKQGEASRERREGGREASREEKAPREEEAAAPEVAEEPQEPAVVFAPIAADISEDGTFITVTAQEGKLEQFNVSERGPAGEISGQPEEIVTLTFNARAGLGATAGGDGTVRFWRPESFIDNTFDEFSARAFSGDGSTPFVGHTTTVNAVDVDPLGRYVASAGQDGTVRLWRLAGQQVETYTDHDARLTTVHGSQSGEILVTGAEDGSLVVWNAATMQPRIELRGHSAAVTTVFLDEQSATLFSADRSGEVRQWQLAEESTELSFRPHDEPIVALHYDTQRKHLLTAGSKGTVRRWLLPLSRPRQLANLGSDPTQMTVIAEGRQIVVASKGTVRVIDYKTGDVVRSLPLADVDVTALTVSEDERRLAVGDSDGRLTIFDVISSERVASIRDPKSKVESVAISSDGSTTVASWGDSQTRAIHLAETLPSLREHVKPVRALAASSDGSFMVSASDDTTVRAWDPGRQEALALVGVCDGAARQVVISSDSKDIAVLDEHGNVKIWRRQGETEFQELAGLPNFEKRVARIAWAGKRLLAADIEGTVLPATIATEGSSANEAPPSKSWETRIKQNDLVLIAEHDERLLTVERNGRVMLWSSASEGTPLPVGSLNRVNAAAWNAATSTLALAHNSSSLTIWNVEKQQSVRTLDLPGAISSISFDRTGKRIGAVVDDRQVVWTGVDEGDLTSLASTGTRVNDIVMPLPDDETMFIAADDNTIRVAKPVVGTPVASNKPLKHVQIVGNGSRGVGLDNGALFVFDTIQGQSVPHQLGVSEPLENLFAPADQPSLYAMGRSGLVYRWADVRNLEATPTTMQVSGDFLAVAPGNATAAFRDAQGLVHIWDLDQGVELQPLSTNETTIQDAAFTSDGQALLLTTGAGTLESWPITCLQAVQTHENRLLTMAVDPKSQQTITVGGTQQVRVWDENLRKVEREFEAEGAIQHASIDAARHRIAMGFRATNIDQVAIWDYATGTEVQTLPLTSPTSTLFHLERDGVVVVATEKRDLLLLHPRDGLVLERTTTPSPVEAGSGFELGKPIRFSTDSKALLELRPSLLRAYREHPFAVTDVTVRSDGALLAACGDDGSVHLWTPELAESVGTCRGLKGVPSELNFSLDGSLLVASSLAGEVVYWDMSKYTSVGQVLEPAGRLAHSGGVWDASISLDGTSVATAGQDGVVRVWDVKTGTETELYVGHESPVQRVEFTSNNSQVVSLDESGLVKIWTRPPSSGAGQGTVEVTASDSTQLRSKQATQTAPTSENGLPNLPFATTVDGESILNSYVRALRTEQDSTRREELRRKIISESSRDNPRPTGLGTTGNNTFANDGRNIIANGESGGESIPLRLMLNRELTQGRESPLIATQRTAIYTDFQIDPREYRPIKLAVTGDGRTLVAVQAAKDLARDTKARHGHGIVFAWDVETRSQLRRWSDIQDELVSEISFLPGEQAVIALPSAQVFDLFSGRSRRLAANCRISSMPVSPHDLFCVGLPGKQQETTDVLRLHDASTLDPTPVAYQEYEATVTALSYAPEGTHIIAAIRMRDHHRLARFDAQTLSEDPTPFERHPHRKAWYEPDSVPGITEIFVLPGTEGKGLVTYGRYDGKKFAIRFREGPNLIRELTSDTQMLDNRVSDPIWLIGSSNRLGIMQQDAVTIVDLKSLKSRRLPLDSASVSWGRPEVAVSEDGRWVATGDGDGQVFLWDLETQAGPFMFRPQKSRIIGLAFSSTGNFLASASEQDIRVWELTLPTTEDVEDFVGQRRRGTASR